ncbi:response regulator [bacterium]|nr:response regulator [candidate division CSSED10-310 bacterium]
MHADNIKTIPSTHYTIPAMAYRVWTDLNGIILRVSGIPWADKLQLLPGTPLVNSFSSADHDAFFSLIQNIKRHHYLETCTVTMGAFPCRLTATPETNSKRLTEIAFTLSNNEPADTLSLDTAASVQIVQSLLSNPTIWLDVVRLTDARILLWNNGATHISGYTREETVGAGVVWGWLYPETDYRISNWHLLMENLETQGISEMISRIRCRDGSDKIMGWTSHFLRSMGSRPESIVTLGFDLTRETHYRNALSSSEEEYRALADNSPDLIARFDQQYICTYTNAPTSPFNPFGITRELIGQTPAAGLSNPDVATSLENRIRQCFNSRTIQSFEISTNPTKGTSVFEVHIVPEMSPEEIIRSVLVISRDISIRRWSENRLRTAERFEAAGRVACEITHNINNRLTVLNGKLEILKRRLISQPDIVSLIDELLTISSQASGEIRDTLAMGRSTEIQAPVNVIRQLESILDQVGSSSHGKIRFEHHSTSTDAVVFGSKQQVENLLLNLVINAVDAMPDGGVLRAAIQKIHLSINDPRSTIWNLQPGNFIRIEICDTGTGIPESIRNKIFDPLFTTKSHRNGSGMGLATVYSIVTAMKGAIDFISSEGQGSCFIVLLPEYRLASTSVERIELQPGTNPRANTGMHILWVDDNQTVLDVAVEMAETLGHHTTAALDGFEAVKLFRIAPDMFDFVVLDVHMPGMNGWDTFIKLLEIKPDATVVVCTGRGLSSEADKMIRHGAYTILHKPFTASDLNDLMNAIARSG